MLCSFWLRLFRTRTKSVTRNRNPPPNVRVDVPLPIAENPDRQTPLGAQYQSEQHLGSSRTTVRSSRPRPPSGTRRASNTSESQASGSGSTIITPNPAPLLDQAVAALDSIVDRTRDGIVLAGTLVGLVGLLIDDLPDIRQNTEYRDQFFTTYCAFTTAERVFQLLVQKYHEADTLPLGSQAAKHFNIILVMKHWVETSQVPIDTEVLEQMKNFTKSMANSRPMKELANQVAKGIDERVNAENPIPSSLDVPIPNPADITPRDLAIALTALEGEEYNSLFAADYILHILQPSSSNKVNSAINTNSKIITWVKMSILAPDDYDFRAEVFKFFINTASECRQLRNFYSIAAIIKALQSPEISRLMVTQRALNRDGSRMLNSLSKLVKHEPYFRPYKAALNDSNKPCVPWIDVHIHDLEGVLRDYPPVVKMDDRPLINFGRSIQVTNWIRKLRNYKTPCKQRDQSAGPLAYLRSQLGEINMTPATKAALEARSLDFAEKEKKIHDHRVREFKSLGLRTS